MPDEQNPDERSQSGTEGYVLADMADATLTIDGQKVDYFHAIIAIELEQFVDDHHVCRVVIHEDITDEKGEVFSAAQQYTDLLGKSFSLKITATLTNEPAPVEMSFTGLIGNVELKNSVEGLFVITLSAYSPTITMDGAPKNAFFEDSKASEIIEGIVGNYPITKGQTESTSGVMKFCVQYRETDYDFIMRLATGAGMFAYYTGQEFCVAKAASDTSVSLEYPVTLGSFSLNLGTASYEYNTAVYNYTQKKKYTQDSKSISQQAALSETGQLAADVSKELYKESGFTPQASPVDDARSLDTILSLRRSQAMGRMVTARGQSGNPTVVIGSSVKIANMGQMSGTYWVTRVKHVYKAGGYYNTFECVPIELACPQTKSARPTITNVQMAEVVDNNDPDHLGRIKVKFPWLDTGETPWVRFVTAHAGQDRGWYALPEIGDEVLVGYEQGSPDLPIALGALYNKENAPPSDVVNADNNVKAFVTRSGNKIVLTDEDGKEKIEIMTKDGKNLVTMQSGGPTTIEGEGAINIKGGGDLKIEAAKITMESQGDIEIKAGANAKFEGGANTTVKGGAQLKIEGTMVTVKGNPIQLN